MYEYLNVGSCEVLDFANLYLVFIDGLGDRLDKCFGSLGERYVTYYQCFLVNLFNFCTNLDGASALTVVVLAYID